MDRIKVAIGMPCCRQIEVKTTLSLLELVKYGGYDFQFFIAMQGYTISENRNWLVYQAIQNGCDYLLMVDDDMVFPPDTIDKLIFHKKDIVGVTYHPRNEKKDTYVPLDITHTDNLERPSELFECKGVGTGVMLIDLKIIPKIPPPFFDTKVHESGKTLQGEDWWFCEKARNYGFSVWCDPKIEIKHIGKTLF